MNTHIDVFLVLSKSKDYGDIQTWRYTYTSSGFYQLSFINADQQVQYSNDLDEKWKDLILFDDEISRETHAAMQLSKCDGEIIWINNINVKVRTVVCVFVCIFGFRYTELNFDER